ncbi:MAG: TorF family putative porin [Rhodomicrobium sp.]
MKVRHTLRMLAGAAMACAMTPALAADLTAPVSMKDQPAAAPTPDWDIAFGGYAASDYIFRGITQSDHQASGNVYSELRYNLQPTIQFYAGSSMESIDFPNHAAGEADFYAGVRPTIGKLSLDFGGWYYDYPGGDTYNGLNPHIGANTSCTNGVKYPSGACNISKSNDSFWEIYAKGTYAINDMFTVGANLFYDPSWVNTGADGTYASGTLKATIPASYMPKDIGSFLSGEFGHYWFGTTDAFYGDTKLPDYNTWNAGISFTYKVFTLDLRYYDTDLSKANCNVLTGDQTATLSGGALQSNWCGSTFVVKGSFDLTANTNLK